VSKVRISDELTEAGACGDGFAMIFSYPISLFLGGRVSVLVFFDFN